MDAVFSCVDNVSLTFEGLYRLLTSIHAYHHRSFLVSHLDVH